MTNRDVDLALDKLGIFIQTERPLHEPVMSYFEVRGLGRTNEHLEWWKNHPGGCPDPLWEGHGHRAKAYAEARRLLHSAVAEGRLVISKLPENMANK